MGAIRDDAECSYEKDLCKKFVEQARLNGDPVHYGRAIAMEGETLGRLNNFEQALETLEVLKRIYNIETQHEAICKAYGSDRCAQLFSHSINWNSALGRSEAALETSRYVIDELFPKSDPKNVHNSFCMFYSSIIAMKENGMALQARDVMILRIVEPFDEHFGSGGSTFSKPLFYPILMLLDLQGNQDRPVERIDEYFEWVSDEKNFTICSAFFESAWAAISVSPNVILGEVCYYLAKRSNDVEVRNRLIRNGSGVIAKAVAATESLPWANMHAKKKLQEMKSLAEECNCCLDESDRSS